MTQRSDIIGHDEVYQPDGSIRKYGLIYTEKCGWIDLGHANPAGAAQLWRQVESRTRFVGAVDELRPVTDIIYSQSMKRSIVTVSETRRYSVHTRLPSRAIQEGIALAIFMDVSMAFEGLQSNWFFRHVSDSGFSTEDLVSNLIGFYRALRPGDDFIKLCQPVSKQQALDTWDTYGAVGRHKNKTFNPIFFPNPAIQKGKPTPGKLPPELNEIKPAIAGKYFWQVQ